MMMSMHAVCSSIFSGIRTMALMQCCKICRILAGFCLICGSFGIGGSGTGRSFALYSKWVGEMMGKMKGREWGRGLEKECGNGAYRKRRRCL